MESDVAADINTELREFDTRQKSVWAWFGIKRKKFLISWNRNRHSGHAHLYYHKILVKIKLHLIVLLTYSLNRAHNSYDQDLMNARVLHFCAWVFLSFVFDFFFCGRKFRQFHIGIEINNIYSVDYVERFFAPVWDDSICFFFLAVRVTKSIRRAFCWFILLGEDKWANEDDDERESEENDEKNSSDWTHTRLGRLNKWNFFHCYLSFGGFSTAKNFLISSNDRTRGKQQQAKYRR